MSRDMVLTWIDAHRDDAVRFLQQIIQIPA